MRTLLTGKDIVVVGFLKLHTFHLQEAQLDVDWIVGDSSKFSTRSSSISVMGLNNHQ